MLTGTDPGVTGDVIEADLDLDWSGAIAPNATIVYVYSTDVVTSIEYAIDQNVAPVMSMSYGQCEQTGAPGDNGVLSAGSAAGQCARYHGLRIVG